MNNLNKTYLILVLIILIGAFFRFYKLDWGQGLFTHPDEYHIVISVNQLSFPSQMHPHFFSYGTVIIYLIYFTNLVLNFLSSSLSAVNTFFIGRLYSALFSTFTILLVYKISSFVLPKRYALLAAALTALTPGLIQQAHFATPESTLIFFLLGILLYLLNFSQKFNLTYLAVASIFMGLTLGIKVSSFIFWPAIVLTTILSAWPNIFKVIKLTLFSLIITVSVFALTSPYVFLDFPRFYSSINYEGSLATGLISVFYTRQFIDTLPILFQLEKIYPYALGPVLLILGIFGFMFMFYQIFKSLRRHSPFTNHHLLITTCFLLLFLPNAFLFAKWTRFISPTFPFFAIFSAIFLFQLKSPRLPPLILNSVFLILNFLWGIAFFSIYLRPDVRITASKWLESSVTPHSVFLVEGGNMIDLPLRGDFEHISLDFYNLEEDAQTREKIIAGLERADYFLIQSRRVFINHQRLPNIFPQTAKFYDSLFDGSLGFTKIKEFHSYPGITLFGLKVEYPDEKAEETWSVFDHPVIRVFQKDKQLTNQDYSRLIGN